MFRRSGDQELFEETTRRFLEAECPITQVRELASTERGFDADYWRKGSALGWTSLLVPEEAGGGSITGGHGVSDLALLAYQFGAHAAPGPLIATNLVAAALGRWGSAAQQAGPLAELLGGDGVATWVPYGVSTFGDADARRLNGGATLVESGADAEWLLVAAADGDGASQFLVPRGAKGVQVSRLHGLDLTRRWARVRLDDVHVSDAALVGHAREAAADVEWLRDVAAAMQLAEMCGAMRWAFDTTVEWAFNRYSFGRPLASYQELKHRFADMKLWLEASEAISSAAVEAIDGDVPDAPDLVSAGKFFVGRYGVELMQDCVQMHGGIGVTFDHDLHLFLRRVVADSETFGTPAFHARRLTQLVEAAL